MKVLLTGAGGQVGYELRRTKPSSVDLQALASDQLDITDADAVSARVVAERPDVIINAAAYTAVDKAEGEPDVAFAVNAAGVQNLARAAAATGSYFVHISTDFVFDGAASRPYPPEAEPRPLGVYGGSKLAGEQAIIDELDAFLVLRTAWVYSAHGANFVKTMLRLMSEREELSVVADQVGTPTWAHGLAVAIWRAAEQRLLGMHHWTDAGVASWYDFAIAIAELGQAAGLITRTPVVHPIRTEDYPTPAQRPSFSVLDKHATWQALDLKPMHWRAALAQMLADLNT